MEGFSAKKDVFLLVLWVGSAAFLDTISYLPTFTPSDQSQSLDAKRNALRYWNFDHGRGVGAGSRRPRAVDLCRSVLPGKGR